MMACFLLKYRSMASAMKGHLAMKAVRFLAISMFATMLTTACPVPVQYPLEPEEENEPLQVNAEYTDPFVGTTLVTQATTPTLTIVVDDPNRDDYIAVKVLLNPQSTWSSDTESPKTLLTDSEISPLDILPPEDASNMEVPETTRRAEVELGGTPCPTVSPNAYDALLMVCLTDRKWQTPPPGYPDDNPCIPRDGYVDTYTVMVSCIPDEP